MRFKLVVIVILLLSGFLGFMLSYYQHANLNSKSRDIQIIETYHYPSLFVTQLRHDPQAGKKIFNEFCSACHSQQPFIDVKAPHVGDKQAWQMRRKLGIDVLLKITIHGVGAMPARGGCFECSDEQLRATIAYMLNQ